MGDSISIFVSAVLVQNIILASFLGICPFLGVSKKTSSAIGMGLAVTFVIVISSILTWLLYHYLLVPFEITFMRTIVFILLIASLVQFVEMIIKKFSPSLYKSLGVFLPLITTNCAVLGATILNIDRELTLISSIINGLGISIGFTLVIYIFSTIRERLELANVPKGFRGVPISLITAALMSMAFLGFAGLGV